MKRLFLSFKVEDKKRVDGLRLLAANPKFSIEFYDESVRVPIESSNSDYIKRKIQEKISRAGVVLCLLSEDTHTSNWVNWELEHSFKTGKKVLCMSFPNGPELLTLPPAAVKNGIGWYRWDLEWLERQLA